MFVYQKYDQRKVGDKSSTTALTEYSVIYWLNK